MREALLIIDVQNDYFPGGANELVRPYEAEKRIQELIAESRANGRPIIYIQHFNPPDDYFSWKEQEALRFPNGSNRKRATKSLSSTTRTAFWKQTWMPVSDVSRQIR